MLRYLVWRLVWVAPVTLAVVVLTFLLTRLIPGDPISAVLGDMPIPPAYLAELRARYGLDEPLPLQLLTYLRNLAHGDLGYSLFNRMPVLEVIGERSSNTLVLVIPVLILSSFIGVVLGLLAAATQRWSLDLAITVLTTLGKSVPVFWSGQVLIVLFAVKLGILPAQGMHSIRGVTGGFGSVLDVMRHWLMPGLVATSFNMVVVARIARQSFKQTLVQDFVATGVAAGLSWERTLWRHVLPNAFLPILTVIGHNVGNLLTGTIMVEAVFGWPGIGSLFLSAVSARDYPVLQGLFLLTALTTVGANLITDILYAVIDPRIRSSLEPRAPARRKAHA